MSQDSDAAAWALGRLSMAVERSPLRSLWLAHETATVVARLFSRGVEPMSVEDVLRLSSGMAEQVPSINEAAAKRFWGQAMRLWRPRVTATPLATIPEVTNHLSELAIGEMPAGDLALESPLRMGAVTGWALPSVVLALPPSDQEDWRSAFFNGLAGAAETGLQRLEYLERDFARWQSLLPDARSDSRLGDAVVLLGTLHALSPRYVSDALGLTRQASARLLKRLEGLGIVRKATKRQRWIIYLAANASRDTDVPEDTKADSVPDVIDTSQIDRVLDDAYRALDRSLRTAEPSPEPH